MGGDGIAGVWEGLFRLSLCSGWEGSDGQRFSVVLLACDAYSLVYSRGCGIWVGGDGIAGVWEGLFRLSLCSVVMDYA